MYGVNICNSSTSYQGMGEEKEILFCLIGQIAWCTQQRTGDNLSYGHPGLKAGISLLFKNEVCCIKLVPLKYMKKTLLPRNV